MSQINFVSRSFLHTQHQAVMDSVLTADMEAVTFNEFSFLVTELRKLKDETSNRSSASNYRNAYVCLQLQIGKGPLEHHTSFVFFLAMCADLMYVCL